MKSVKRVLVFLLVVLVAMQFFRPEKNIAQGSFPQHISSLYPVPAEVDAILKKSCNDCHSNNTTYPWYNNFQPVSGWLHHHIDEGKHEINFDEFTSYRIGKQYHKLEEIMEQVEEKEMPLSSYTLIHKDANLGDAQRKLIMQWADSLRSIIRAKYPADSLVSRRPPKKD